VRFRPKEQANPLAGDYLVVLRGDMILSFKKPDDPRPQLALDGNHLGPGLPGRCPTGDKIEGGRFESWFTIS